MGGTSGSQSFNEEEDCGDMVKRTAKKVVEETFKLSIKENKKEEVIVEVELRTVPSSEMVGRDREWLEMATDGREGGMKTVGDGQVGEKTSGDGWGLQRWPRKGEASKREHQEWIRVREGNCRE